MTLPSESSTDSPPPLPRSLAFNFLGAVILLPGIVGGVLVIAYTLYWMSSGFHFKWDEQIAGPVFTILGTIGVLTSVLLFGIWLRFSRWEKAHTASLWISIIGALAIAIAYLMAFITLYLGDYQSQFNLSAVAVGALIVACLPPFLFWYRAGAVARESQ
jgi:hypothetical protein